MAHDDTFVKKNLTDIEIQKEKNIFEFHFYEKKNICFTVFVSILLGNKNMLRYTHGYIIRVKHTTRRKFFLMKNG